MQINSHDEIFIIDLSLSSIDCLTEARHRKLSGQRGFKNQCLFQINAFTHRSRFISNQLGEFLRLKPDTDERVTFGQNQQRIEAGLLKRRSEEKCGVQARSY